MAGQAPPVVFPASCGAPPSSGEIVLFDGSWYNRAGVERVMGFCFEEEYREFLRSVPEFERMLIRSDSISRRAPPLGPSARANVVDPGRLTGLPPTDARGRSTSPRHHGDADEPWLQPNRGRHRKWNLRDAIYPHRERSRGRQCCLPRCRRRSKVDSRGLIERAASGKGGASTRRHE
jgi:polyphosphate kinase 2 PPK2